MDTARLLALLLCVLACFSPGAMAQPAEDPQEAASTKVQWITPEVKAPPAPEPAKSQQEIGWEAIIETSTLTTVATGCRFTEGPLWRADGTLLFSDIPANTVFVIKPDAANTTPQELRKPSGNTNGNTFDFRGRLLSANHNGTLTRHETSGKITVLASKFEGKRLNSPNDVVVRSDGKIYFTDPTYGVK